MAAGGTFISERADRMPETRPITQLISSSAAFAVTLALTPFFPAPSPEVQRMVDAIREPEGVGPAVDIEAAIDH